jgi:CelD/BcsL family acetyltransferase involved in cellulose biosynthesis
LAGDCVFRTWTWLSTWWRHYGSDGDAATEGERRRRRQLFLLLAIDEPDAATGVRETKSPTALIAVLPCYLTHSLVRGRVLRLLGDGQVCSDHLGMLASPTHATAAATAIAKHLVANSDWDFVDFAAVDEDDQATALFHAALGDNGCRVSQEADDRCWSIDLPNDWEGLLALQSKSHRKQLRQLERRVLDSGQTQWRLVERAAEFENAWNVLIDLHQRRRKSLGEPGCFASRTWASFHRDVARKLLDERRLRLSWLHLGDSPIAAEYHFAGRHTTYAYQGGVDPSRLNEEPGRLSTICAIRQALAEGHRRVDFLRGDEPYKAHWRAAPRPTCRYQAEAPRRWSRLRGQAWLSARRVSHLVKQLPGLFS